MTPVWIQNPQSLEIESPFRTASRDHDPDTEKLEFDKGTKRSSDSTVNQVRLRMEEV